MVRFGFSGSTGAAWNLQKACFTEPPDVLGPDLGDAPDLTSGTGVGDYTTTYENNGAIHVQSDDDDNGQIDLRLGNMWDTDLGDGQNPTATADDENNYDDEDGVTFSLMHAKGGDTLNISIDVQADTAAAGQPIHLYGWLDFNRDGDWDDANEQVISTSSAVNGTNVFPVTIPSDVTFGYSFLRVRLCDSTVCNKTYGTANKGEVEDYRFLFYELNENATCNLTIHTQEVSASKRLENIDLANTPISMNGIVDPITIVNQTNVSDIDAIGFDAVTGFIYGTFVNADTNNIHLFVTDRDATSVVDLGYIYAESNVDINKSDGSTVSLEEGQILNTSLSIPAPSAGDISSDNQYLFVWHQDLTSIIKIDTSTQSFSVMPLQLPNGVTGLSGGGDLAVDDTNHNIYFVDIEAGNFYEIHPTNGLVTTHSLTFNGLSSPQVDGNGNLKVEGLLMDTTTNLYVMTNGGNHDI